MIPRAILLSARRLLCRPIISPSTRPILTTSLYSPSHSTSYPLSLARFFASKSKKTEGAKPEKTKMSKSQNSTKQVTTKEKKKKAQSKEPKQQSKSSKKAQEPKTQKKKLLLYSSQQEDQNPILAPQISILDLSESKSKARHQALSQKIDAIKKAPIATEPPKKKAKSEPLNQEEKIEPKVTLSQLNSKIKLSKKSGELAVKIGDYVDVIIPKQHVSALQKLKQLLKQVGIQSLTAFCDGGWKSRKDVGAIGVCIVAHDTQFRQNYPLLSLGVKLHNTTNNQCEHLAIIFALILFEKLGLQKCSILSDSDLAICQVNGTMKIYNAALKQIVAVTHLLVQDFKEVDFTFIRREYNQLADSLVKLQFESTVPVHFTLSTTGLSYLEELL